MSHTMNRFPTPIWIAIGLAGTLVLGATSMGFSWERAQGQRRPGGGTRYALTLDKAFAGFASSFEGGGARGTVVDLPGGNSKKPRKTLAGFRSAEMAIEVPATLEQPLFDWMVQAWAGQLAPRNGAVFTLESSKNAVGRLEFSNGIITETTIPDMNVASKQDGMLSIKIAPQTTRRINASGPFSAPIGPQTKVWQPSNFRLQIVGLDCTRVARIEALKLKIQVDIPRVGSGRNRELGKLELPNLVFYLPEAFAKPFFDWHEEFVIKGINGDDRERAGSLELLDPSMKPLLTIGFSHLGIVSVDPDSSDGGPRMVRVEMYCEDMTLAR